MREKAGGFNSSLSLVSPAAMDGAADTIAVVTQIGQTIVTNELNGMRLRNETKKGFIDVKINETERMI